MTSGNFGDDAQVGIDIADNIIHFTVQVSSRKVLYKHNIDVKYDFGLDLNSNQVDLLRIGMTVFISQLFLCANVNISEETNCNLISKFGRLTNLLYNIRNYEEYTNILPPRIWLENHAFPKRGRSKDGNLTKPKCAINLVTGGKDSYVSGLLLRRNEYKVINCHIAGLNIATTDLELAACQKLYDAVTIVHVQGFDSLVRDAASISRCLGRPPAFNYVPRGRDILSVFFALPIAQNNRATYLSLSCERDLWKNNIVGERGQIPIHDTQSELTVAEISGAVRYVMPNVHVFSPIAGLHEIKSLMWLLRNKPEVIEAMSSCFFGKWCGQCSKCARYYLIQEFSGIHVINFRSNPLHPLCPYLKRFLKNPPDPGLPFQSAVSFLLEELHLVEHHVSTELGSVSKAIDSQYDNPNDLFRVHPASLMPRKFRSSL
jgi:7-cyano-7-deazaguanine synthase in queuosine biosynthesis